ncbi:tRNA pseudouridine(38-40) synthase TruA [Bythopirellula polymerisocia]|uniref:tRNA pseudouridine synthase A n=1 Tax=Bythopirellula polymerisocia TaxID=2528003 RepID=A0A5C6CJK8_9BACT|nr:tRNA pseudouridine(38-40) synthase TruA [Bythopirellula polymerisocia]TWU23767.1 tRNA pseudouridine synthase A [Bythopirellula polymerisocia]
MMPTFKLTIGFDGTKFSGWQVQPDRRTVQGAIQDTWQKITGEAVHVTASSRTDAGVHALGQVVGVSSATHLDAEQLHRALNALLPVDVIVKGVEMVTNDFHATYNAIGKRYRYRIYNSRCRPLFERDMVWHVPQMLDTEAMHQAAHVLVGTHDFASFQSAGSERESTVRTISAIEVQRGSGEQGALVEVDVEGNGFLYNMVRIIVGSLVEIGMSRRDKAWLAAALKACDRRQAGRTAPPQGLCLMRVDY